MKKIVCSISFIEQARQIKQFSLC